MDNKSISNWIRQTRYRAKRHNIISDLTVEDVLRIVTKHSSECLYCGSHYKSVDCPFPLQESTPHIPANLALICLKCKAIKRNNDIIWMYMNGHLTKKRYLEALEALFNERGGETIKNYVRLATGLA